MVMPPVFGRVRNRMTPASVNGQSAHCRADVPNHSVIKWLCVWDSSSNAITPFTSSRCTRALVKIFRKFFDHLGCDYLTRLCFHKQAKVICSQHGRWRLWRLFSPPQQLANCSSERDSFRLCVSRSKAISIGVDIDICSHGQIIHACLHRCIKTHQCILFL
jgi:hypothetical protein